MSSRVKTTSMHACCKSDANRECLVVLWKFVNSPGFNCLLLSSQERQI